jgi:transposase-like protein
MDTPVPPAARSLKLRRWTPKRQAAFLKALGATASVTEAARRVGMTPQSAHWLRRHPEAAAFRKGWDAALEEVAAQVHSKMLERVLNGEVRITERNGVRIVRTRPCAPSLLIHMLNRVAAERETREKDCGIGK